MSGILSILRRRPFAVVGHRGAAGLCWENTIGCIKLALETGVDAVEVDVRLTRDGVPVLVHDPDLARLAGLGVRVADASYEWLAKNVQVGGVEPIPTLDDALKAVGGRGGILVEVKEREAVAAAVEVLEAWNALDWSMLASFSLDDVQAARRLSGNIHVGVFCARCREVTTGLGEDVEALLMHYSQVDREAVRIALSAGVILGAWVVNSLSEARRLANLGVNALITDHPDRLVELRRRLAGVYEP